MLLLCAHVGSPAGKVEWRAAIVAGLVQVCLVVEEMHHALVVAILAGHVEGCVTVGILRGREGGREGGKEGWIEGGREGWRRKGGREGGREVGRKGRECDVKDVWNYLTHGIHVWTVQPI